MPIITGVAPAVRACVHRDAVGEDGTPTAQPPLEHSTALADVAEALQHVSALNLTLHRKDGSLVPTELVGIQDTEQLLALAAMDLAEFDDAECDSEECFFDDAPDGAPWDRDLELDPGDAMLMDEMTDGVRPSTPEDDEPTAFPRYQVHVVLVDPAAIP